MTDLGLGQLVRSEDRVKTDLELLCIRCGERLCDAEDGDTLEQLAAVLADHLPICLGR